MQLPNAEALNAYSNIPILALAMGAVILSIFMLIILVRSMAGKQTSQDNTVTSVVGVMKNQDTRFSDLTATLEAQSKTYAILAGKLTEAMTVMPTTITEAFLKSFQSYSDNQAKIILAAFEASNAKTAAAIEKMSAELKEFNARLESIQQSTTKTAASVDEATSGTSQKVPATIPAPTAAEMGAAIAAAHAPPVTAAEIGKAVSDAMANNQPTHPPAESGTVQATLTVPNQNIRVEIIPKKD